MAERGTIVFIVGPSGAGKDSLLRYAAAELSDDPGFAFPRRVVTRMAVGEAEPHDSVTPEEFARMTARGEFALAWEAHGLRYGIPVSIDADLDGHRTLAVNVSRTVLGAAVERYPNHLIVSVTAPAETLPRRLAARGREDDAGIAARISRKPPAFPAAARIATIINDGEIGKAGAEFVSLLRGTRRPSWPERRGRQ
jgi:ribose 1,5-bisphosphokinase